MVEKPGIEGTHHHRPVLAVPGGEASGFLYSRAVHNLLDLNIVAGRSADEPPRFIRAGAHYPDPWTRDAAINAWNAASFLAPDVARDTLVMVCQGSDEPILAQDDQWWDQIIWVLAAWHHYLATGDREFLAWARGVGARSLAILHERRFRPAHGLYAGGAVMQDGISGYPRPPWEPGNGSSFVLDYPPAHELMCLSTNALYVGALRTLAAMSRALDAPEESFDERADALASAIDAQLWRPTARQYGYLLHGSGDAEGSVADDEEACGIAFAALFGVADPDLARDILRRTHRQPYGVVNVWPHFPERFSDEQPGRHNAVCWPMVMGMFGSTAAVVGESAVFEQNLDDLERLFLGSDGEFFEIYNAISGEVDGGWQEGAHWPSEPHQTWSATAYLRMIHHGVLGMRLSEDGIRFAPIVPERFDGATLSAVRYRDSSLTITVSGSGDRLASVRLDGRLVDGDVHLPAALSGHHEVVLEMERLK